MLYFTYLISNLQYILYNTFIANILYMHKLEHFFPNGLDYIYKRLHTHTHQGEDFLKNKRTASLLFGGNVSGLYTGQLALVSLDLGTN